MQNQKSTRGPLMIPAMFTTVLILLAFVFVGLMADGNDVALVGGEFQIEGFQKAKIIGVSNGRAIVVLTNNAGHNSYAEISLNTVEMFKSLSKGK